MVESELRAYSSFLSLLYPELMKQAGSLVSEGLNEIHGRLRMRGRPKILLAKSVDEALEIAEKHQNYLLALITGMRLRSGGVVDDHGGLELAKNLRGRLRHLSILMLSAGRTVFSYTTLMPGFLMISSPVFSYLAVDREDSSLRIIDNARLYFTICRLTLSSVICVT